MSKFLISCGGTGGHMSPGIALAEGLVADGHQCVLIISQKDVDSRLIRKYPHLDFEKAPGVGFSWNPIKFIKFNLEQFRGLLFGVRFMRKYRPDAVAGFGGFITATMVFAAFLLGIPVVLHEANRRPGKAIRLLSGFAQRIYLPEGVRLKGISPQTIRHCGFPVRKEIHSMNREEARKRIGMENTGKLLLVLGGSQGAVALNSWVADNLERLMADNVSVYCVTGMKNTDQPKDLIQQTTSSGRIAKAKFVTFSDNMAEVLSAADLVVARAGAGSIAEFIRCRLPSVLVPYPHAEDDHQRANAVFLERQGGGVVLDQKEIMRLNDEVTDIIFNDWLLENFRHNLERLDRYNSIGVIIKDITQLVVRKED